MRKLRKWRGKEAITRILNIINEVERNHRIDEGRITEQDLKDPGLYNRLVEREVTEHVNFWRTGDGPTEEYSSRSHPGKSQSTRAIATSSPTSASRVPEEQSRNDLSPAACPGMLIFNCFNSFYEYNWQPPRSPFPMISNESSSKWQLSCRLPGEKK